MLKTLRIFFLISVFALVNLKVFAGIEPYQNFLKGSIKTGDSLFVKDEKFRNPSFNWADITNISVKNAVSLQVVDEQLISRSFSCTLKVKIAYFSAPTQVEATKIDDIELKVNYDKTAGAVYKGIDTYTFENGYHVKVYVVSINSPEFGSSMPEVLQLSSTINIDRKYAFKPYLFLGINGIQGGSHQGLQQRLSDGNIQNNQLLLSWQLIQGAEEYDIELVSIDEGSEWMTIADELKQNLPNHPNSELDAIFRNNATRVTTHENNYAISLLFNCKYILVRMRQVQYTSDGLRDVGDWFYKQENNDEYAIWSPTWHEENLNWQYAVTYAEEGKKKEVVSYFDGSLRNRQTVTLNNSDDVAVVQENVYDSFGRAAASILPAPVKEATSKQSLHYFPNFNKNVNGLAYSFADLNAANCEPLPSALSINSGASAYYSSQNQFKNLKPYNSYIPDAGGYPLSVTQYTADNTGRIKLQGGVGYTFQPGTSEKHTTRYFYGKPEQWELDRMFGNDVGYAQHYLKNMIVDPNGQISISYLNAAGKTIATALTGATPGNVEALSSKPDNQKVELKILKPEQFQFNSSELVLSATTTYLASVTGAAELSYSIDQLISKYPGGSFQLCSNCYYDLKITVRDNCNNPIYTNVNPVKIGAETADCLLTNTYSSTLNLNFTEIGEYYITFEFALSKQVIERYTDEFITQGQADGHLKKLSDFVLIALADHSFEDCFSDCKTALSKLGSKADFTLMFKNKLVALGEDATNYEIYISGLYDQLYSTASALANSCAVSPCDVYKVPMLEDVSPGGQFALVDEQGAILEPSINVLKLYFQNGAFDPLDPSSAIYQASLFTKDDGTETSPYDAAFNINDLIKYWKPSWANQFLPFHPEYCKLQFCLNNSAAKSWDDKFTEIETASEAGYNRSNPIGWLVNADPFFATQDRVLYRDRMLAALHGFSAAKTGRTDVAIKDINAFIDYMLYCANSNATTNTSPNPNDYNWNSCNPDPNCRLEDREWQLYRDYYFELKAKYVDEIRDAESCGAANICAVGKPLSIGTSGSSVTCISKVLPSTSQQLSSNSYRTFDYINNLQTTIYYVSGTAGTVPSVLAYCAGGNAPVPSFFPCIDLSIDGGTPTRLTNVWEINCVESIPTGCSVTGIVNATGSLGLNQFYEEHYPWRYTHTVMEGYGPDDIVTAGCDGGTGNSDLGYYDCFEVNLNGVKQLFVNVWVSVCYTYLGGSGGGGGGGGGTTPCTEQPNPVLYNSLQENLSPIDVPCEVLEQIRAGDGQTQKTVANYDSKDIYRISTVDPASAARKAIQSDTLSTKRNERYAFDAFEFKSYFAVRDEKNTYKIFRNVWVSKFVAAENSLKGRKAKALESSLKGNSTFTNRSGEVSSLTTGFTDPSSNNRVIFSEASWVYDETFTCGSNYYTEPVNRVTFTLVDANNQPVIATAPIQIEASYYVLNGSNSTNYNTPFSITIPTGQSSVSTDYSTRRFYEQIGGSCYPVDMSFNGISNVVWPVGPICSPLYKDKISRFVKINYDLGTNPAQMEAEQINELNIQIANSCSEQADGWMDRLAAGLNAGSYTVQQKAELKANLITICKLGGDLQHPFGASSINNTATPPVQPLVINGNYAYNFGDVIKFTLGLNDFTALLNPWLLDAPYPFERRNIATESVISATNQQICDKLASERSISGTTGDAAFFSYLQNKFGEAMDLSWADFEVLLKGCTNCKFLLKYDIKLPSFLEPGSGGCLSKADYNAAITQLNNSFGGTLNSSSSNYEQIVRNFLNFKTGFSYTYDQYMAFAASSKAQLCNEPPYTSVPEDPYACVKSLIELSFGQATELYNNYITEERKKFVSAYVNTCASAQPNVKLKAFQQTYHYTLYYYDLASNLVRTVPPEGVTLLSDQEVDLVDQARKFNPNACNYTGPSVASDENAALQNLSNVLQSSAGNAIEMWFYSNSSDGRQFIAASPDMKYMLQACINGNLLNVDIFTLTQTAVDNVSITKSNHVTANISGILPLTPWTHLVVQGTDLANGTLQIWVNGKSYTAVSGAPNAGCTWEIGGNPLTMPRNFGILKHLRTYSNRLMSAAEIANNAASTCFGVANQTDLAWYRFNVPLAGSATTIAANSTVETQFKEIYPNHYLTTTYTYNATNQVVQQKTPDAGMSRFWYDDLSRLVISQNAKQEQTNDYSYTDYDALGRIVEVGQKNYPNAGLTNEPRLSEYTYRNFLAQGTNTQINQTIYDVKPTGAGTSVLNQNNLRKRVSASIYRETLSANINATYYNYDIAGNVKTLYQQIDGLGIKQLDYEYDLISGKVNFLAYQNGHNDQFYYQYKYDAENRLLEAWSAVNANLSTYGFGSTLIAPHKRLDATYEYYLHGPLARMELGNEGSKVQGIDYAYTLQGWLKGVNSTNLNPDIDMGRDGSVISTIGKDAYSYTLHYYGQNDYVPIGTFYNHTRPFFGGYTANEFKPLYNGNIAMMGVNLPKVGTALQYAYSYDQLNRISQATSYEGLNPNSNIWTPNKLEDFRENFTYDANGNILTLHRKGNNTFAGMPLNMDNLKYSYYYIKADGTKGTYRPSEDAAPGDAVAFTNQLSGISDNQNNSNNYPNDIDHQTPTNYVYDRIGNLIKDRKEGLVNIDWNVYGKIKSIGKDLNGDQTIDKTIAYQYDASGNRVSKTYDGTATYYVRDAQGNALAVYDKQHNNPLYWREQQLYGSSRLGVWKPNVNLVDGNAQQFWNDVGNKFFELSNHLGNVMAVITDKRVPVEGGGYEAEIINANDYYAFGSQMPGRSFSSGGNYRYGFNGKENDNEVKGEGNQQDYGMRIYDPRIGRFLSVDPLTKDFPSISSYGFAENDVIRCIDLEGLEKYNVIFRSFAPRGSFEDTHFETKADDRTVFQIARHEKVSARIHATIFVDLDRWILDKDVTAEPTILRGPFKNKWNIGTKEITAKGFGSKKDKRMRIEGGYYAKNGTEIGPGIDIQFGINIQRDNKNILNISAKITGNKFPAQETMIFDENGTGLFLGTSTASGGPLTDVWGSGKNNILDFNKIKVQTDDRGNFQGVFINMGKGKEIVVSVDSYNLMFEARKVWNGQDNRNDYDKK